ncbi:MULTISPECIES: glycosyltransferase family 2 protein [Mesonia]|uniref:Poly-beta-1,6-N-acetyl-D-glucosamine synthase n=1 Tax=Mesonia oceanica TaxID=2687242 RepID=A0AC61Y8I6_9FLAO|nr:MULTISPECIES: glycosyltransferase [Mesonia]MAN28993.1 glycosyl transferase family 2 [Mesonia sp.]MAQ42773.1 glycosyl transferase family 2 [Mesonia sp.]MBJ99311.1 glycosyl transferase family 2 [Flavobacteriaceae bacterium]VVU99689.1 Poly-beta-1,6-N-acetyl-D-glucosamine synthase [Mesonia oceanica]|tara:strand:+ start:45056 stop:46468 length:1413 start_codon:yes stop_codon:yes gene_type:complete
MKVDHLFSIFAWLFIAYSILVYLGYLVGALFSFLELREYKQNNLLENEVPLLKTSNLPAVSILAPAYNESVTIIENVRSLLTLNYPAFEIVIINDGSSDDSLEKLIATFQLKKDTSPHYNFIATAEVKAVYKSQLSSFASLTVIDKENGGKADALNAGVNIAEHQLVCCIDVDCILEQDALVKLVKPFLNSTKKKVIAAGGVIRIANSCTIEDGKLVKVELPKSFIARAQLLEYFRAFLMGRMAWSRIDGLLIISGAFGMFDKNLIIEAGGYNTKTVGEDMELLVRMRKMMRKKEVPYEVGFIPNPLCWTEVPEDLNVLSRQRNRWARGCAETLWIHRRMLFNPYYKTLGLLSAPYWFFFEWLAPIIEFIGILFFIYLTFTGQVNWVYSISFFIVVYFLSVLFSITAIFFEEYSFQQYKNLKDIFKLILASFLDPLIFHPLVMWYSIRGNIDLFRKKKGWGKMTRKGFTK